MRFATGVLCGALMLAPAERVEVVTETEVIIREVAPAAYEEPEPTPILDSLVDWEEVDRQNECLWQLLQNSDVEITLDVVLAAGTWTDALGGACAVLGEE